MHTQRATLLTLESSIHLLFSKPKAKDYLEATDIVPAQVMPSSEHKDHVTRSEAE